MKKSLVFALLYTLIYSSPIIAQDSLYIAREGLKGGMGVEYNDIWGYVHNGTEYAVIGSNNRINILDVSDCSNPTIQHQWLDGTSTVWRDFKTYDKYIYAVCDACSEGLQIIDMDTYTHYQYTNHFTNSHNIFIDTATAKLYVGDPNTLTKGVLVYDLAANPTDPPMVAAVDFRVVTGDYNTNFQVHDLYVRNDTVWASTGYSGLYVWDFTDYNNVSFIGSLESTQDGYNHSSWPHPETDIFYIAEEVPKGVPIYIFDATDPVNMTEIGNFKNPLLAPTHTDVRPHNPFVHEDYLYISYYLDGLQVYDVSNPSNPVLAAYYDTYPSNTNYNVDGGFNGAWGTYPFLPSGCILVSDITSGLNTLRLEIPPDRDVTSNKDVVLSMAERGIIFTTTQDSLWKLSVSNAGALVAENTTGTSSNTKVEEANLKIVEPGTGLVLKSSNERFWRLTVDNMGNVNTELINLPSEYTSIYNDDITMSTYYGGLILKSPNGTCYKVLMNKNGTLLSESIPCLN